MISSPFTLAIAHMRKNDYFIYILYCENDTYYTGYTVNIEQRYQAHLDGSSKCKYTRSFKPLSIAQCWKITDNRAFAMKIERFIKNLSREEKEQIIHHPRLLAENFPGKKLKSCIQNRPEFVPTKNKKMRGFLKGIDIEIKRDKV